MDSQQTQEFEILFDGQKKYYFLQKQLYFLKKQGYQSIIVLGKNDIGILLQAVSSNYGEVEINILDKELKYAKEIYYENVQIKGLVDCDNLIKIYECLDCEELQAYFIIHEACDCSFVDVIRNDRLQISQIYAITEQLLQGLVQLCNNNVIHSDIKPENIFYIMKKNKFIYSNFGLSHLQKWKEKNSELVANSSLMYMAPELFNDPPFLTDKIDVFSLGVVLAELVRRLRFEGLEQTYRLKHDQISNLIPSNLEQFFCSNIINNMLKKCFTERKNASQLLEILQKSFQFSQKNLSCEIMENFNSQQLLNNSYINFINSQDNIQSKRNAKLCFARYLIDDKKVQQISKALQKCSNLTYLHLDLSVNNISQDGANYIGRALESCQNLTFLKLILFNNQIGSQGAQSLGMSLQKCQQIDYLSLDLQNNQIDHEGAKNLGLSLQKSQNIKTLKLCLNDNQIGTSGAMLLLICLEKCENISFLRLELKDNLVDKSLFQNKVDEKFAKFYDAKIIY